MHILRLTPINMLVSLLVLNLGYAPTVKLYWTQWWIFCFGYLIEVAGIWSGLVFGEYEYRDNLGWQVLDTPLVMGVNWVVTVFCCASMAHHLGIKHKLYKAIVAASMMVLMDAFIEPICEKAGFWAWSEGAAPYHNYIAWLVIGFGIQWVLTQVKISLNNYLAFLLYFLQIIFFIFAYIYL